MIAVIFEVVPTEAGQKEYLTIAGNLREQLAEVPGFISIERFQSMTDPGKMLSLSFWRDETSIGRWRTLEAHRMAQARGRNSLFKDYRIRVASILRDYSLTEREQAPEDSKLAHPTTPDKGKTC